MPIKEFCARCGDPADIRIDFMVRASTVSGVMLNQETQSLCFCKNCQDKAHKSSKDVSKEMVKEVLKR